MRQGIFGVVAYGVAGLGLAQAQYQEPLPIGSPGMRYGAPAHYPAYPPTNTHIVGRQPMPAYWPTPAYPARMPAGYPAPPYPPMAQGGMYDPAILRAGAQVQAPAPMQAAPMPNPPIQPAPSTAAGVQPEVLVAPPHLASEVAGPTPALTDVPEDVSDSGLPVEASEPYMVGLEGTWKPVKGQKLYGAIDYLFWYVKAQPLPTNLSLSTANASVAADLSTDGNSGARALLGIWLSSKHDLSVEGSYFALESRNVDVSQAFPPVALTVRPVFAGIVSDTGQLSAATRFSGAEVNLRKRALPFDCGPVSGHVDFLGGLRYADLSENMILTATTKFGTAPVLLSDTTLTTTDLFGTHNTFFGGQFGLDVMLNWDRVSFNGFAKFAMGNNRQHVIIDGNTQVAGPPVVGTLGVGGGFYAQPTNMGRFRHDAFSMLPETGFNLGYKVCDHCRLAAGYSYLYLSSVARPGEQIDTSRAAGARPALFFLGTPRPQPSFTNFGETGFWAQGINLTVEVNY